MSVAGGVSESRPMAFPRRTGTALPIILPTCEHHGVVVGDELVVLGKSLEQSSLPEADRAILFRMAEAPVAIAEKLVVMVGAGHPTPCDRKRSDNFSPSPCDDTRPRVRRARPASIHRAWTPGCVLIERRQAGGAVEAILRRFTCIQPGKVGNRMTHRFFTSKVAGFLQINFAQAGCEQHQPTALLGNAVIGAVDLLMGNMVTDAAQSADKVLKIPCRRSSGHVLHADDLRQEGLHQTPKLMQEGPFASARVSALGVFGKRLAWRAADQNAETRGTKSIAQLIASISDALVNKTGVRVVVFVGKTGGGVDVISGSHRNTCVEQSARQAASAAEKINGCDVSGGSVHTLFNGGDDFEDL